MESVADKYIEELRILTDKFIKEYGITYLEAVGGLEIYKYDLHANNMEEE